MKLDHALFDQVFQQLICTAVGWLFATLSRALRQRLGMVSRRGTTTATGAGTRPGLEQTTQNQAGS
jgi:hypothetical protein